MVSLGGLELDRERFELRRMGERVPLTATEFKLLSFLMSRPGRVCARSELIHEVWGMDRDVAERGRSLEMVASQYLGSVRPAHERFVAPSRARADLIVPGDADFATALEMTAAMVLRRIR